MRIRVLTPIVDENSRSLKPGMIVTWHDAKEAKRLCKEGYAESEPVYLLRCLKPYGLMGITVGSDAPKGLVKQLREAAKDPEVTIGVEKIKKKPEKEPEKKEPEKKEPEE